MSGFSFSVKSVSQAASFIIRESEVTIYEDEWAFWDDIAGKYIFKHAGVDLNTDIVIKGARFYADAMVLERRRRKRVSNGGTLTASTTDK